MIYCFVYYSILKLCKKYKIYIYLKIYKNTGGNNGVTEYTRNELRAYIGVRSQQGNSRLTGQLLTGQNITPVELDSLGLNFEMSPTSMLKIKFLKRFYNLYNVHYY